MNDIKLAKLEALLYERTVELETAANAVERTAAKYGLTLRPNHKVDLMAAVNAYAAALSRKERAERALRKHKMDRARVEFHGRVARGEISHDALD